MRRDHRTKRTVSHNFVNLPTSVASDNGDMMSYTYTATGIKLSQALRAGKGGTSTRRDYAGRFVFVNNAPAWVSAPHGRFVQVNGSWENEFHLRDHLGNTRVVLMEERGSPLATLQQNHYYPFGMLNPSLSTGNTLGALKDNRYLFQGKELQDDNLGGTSLDIYDFHWRQYDPQIGRTTTLDPHAENYYSLSPYSMFANSPIRYIDPDGRDIYGFDYNTGRLSLVERTEDDFDRIQVGAFCDDNVFTQNERDSFIDIMKGTLLGEHFENISEYGIVFHEGLISEGLSTMQFLSFNSNIEFSAWAYESSTGVGLSISPWDENTATRAYDVYSSPHRVGYGTDNVGYLGKKRFHIHTHPGTKDGSGGFGGPSQSDVNFLKQNPNIPHYIMSRNDGITQYFINGTWKKTGIK